VRKRGTIRLEAEGKNERKDSIRVQGAVAPMRADQRILVDVMLPDGKTHRTTETTTNASGQFSALLSVTDGKKKLQKGPHEVQGFIHNASELSDTESNVVTVVR
jgi:hypothetical protein